MTELQINGRTVSVPAGTSILDAARAAGVEIPTLCHDERLHPAAVCRLCLVEVNGHPHPVAACATPVAAGQKVETHTPQLETGRRATLELLALNHPAEEILR